MTFTDDDQPLLPSQRRARVLDVVRRDGTARVNTLAEELGVTPITIRRDISLMARQGLVRRVHGGVTLPESRRPDSAATAPPPSDSVPELALGMVVPSLDYYWPDIIRSARSAAGNVSARIVLRGATYEAADERQQLSRLVEDDGLDGLLVAPTTTGAEGEALVRWLDDLGTPVVLLERSAVAGATREAMESVVSDHALGAEMAMHHLADLGHSRIGLLTTSSSPTSPHVRRGWRAACERLGLPLGADVPNVESVDHREPEWPRHVEDLLSQCAETGTTALLVLSDQEAISLIEYARERGLTVPDDLSIVAYDDEVAGLADPPLTAVHPPRESIGSAAVRLLADRVRDPDRPAHRVVVAPHLVIRESTATPPARLS
jgi:DNA-binding LacI/PurR family transcriptional regulator